MISIEKLKRVSVVYTHANCPDGMASAMILKDAFRMLKMSPKIEFLVHNTKEHRQAGTFTIEESKCGDYALFCDFAPTKDKKGAGGIIVLDHHVGSKDIIESFGENGVYADAEKEPGVSGAVLAFRNVWLLARTMIEPRPLYDVDLVKDFAECTGVRDTWQTNDPRFRRGQWISKMLMSKPASHWLNEESNPYRDHDPKFSFNHPPYLTESEIDTGGALFEAHEETVRQAVGQCIAFDVEGPAPLQSIITRLYVFQEQANGFRLTSDVAESLRGVLVQGATLISVVAGFSFVVDKPGDQPKLIYSLRGLNGFDVCAFAKANGGGGHKAAAGFSIELSELGGLSDEGCHPYQFIRDLLEDFLQS